jgi:hypothetical protein
MGFNSEFKGLKKESMECVFDKFVTKSHIIGQCNIIFQLTKLYVCSRNDHSEIPTQLFEPTGLLCPARLRYAP